MRDSLYLARQYLRHHRLTSAVLVASITLIIYLPAALEVIVNGAEHHFRARARSTPLIVGPRGSALELVLASVYFDKPYEDVMRLEQLRRIDEQQLGTTIPVHSRFQARDCQIVGTTAGYLSLRGLRLAEGQSWNILGECVVGAGAADRLNIQVGDKIRGLHINGVCRSIVLRCGLKIVAGVLAATETPDDEAIFRRLGNRRGSSKGWGTGTPTARSMAQPRRNCIRTSRKRTSPVFISTASRDQFSRSRRSSSMPASDKAQTILLRAILLSRTRPPKSSVLVQVSWTPYSPRVVMVRSYMIAIIAVVSLVTLLTLALVIVLSIRLRRGEIVTISKMGCSRFTIASIVGSQIAIILAGSVVLAALLTFATSAYGPQLARMLIL